ncbi:hypothetical protein GM415_09855 [Pseudodesulfovibrio cashew]|uniref:Uncharacterized protein n=1 Tax=Pseudodesulfovibrio cashew TaxID=2678688 RepID=A0A6I6JJV7_9BACT|nr:hypothetical protein [Pseudodesulfovibrio cashew]QGY40417.1 hypothetical protein GM415_09855 [Pseudodesulfovibrio cashew]
MDVTGMRTIFNLIRDISGHGLLLLTAGYAIYVISIFYDKPENFFQWGTLLLPIPFYLAFKIANLIIHSEHKLLKILNSFSDFCILLPIAPLLLVDHLAQTLLNWKEFQALGYLSTIITIGLTAYFCMTDQLDKLPFALFPKAILLLLVSLDS